MKNKEEKLRSEFIENNAYGVQAFILVFGSCVASIAAMCVLKYSESVLFLALTAVLAMGTNALCIAQAKISITLKVFYAAISINVLIILFELITG